MQKVNNSLVEANFNERIRQKRSEISQIATDINLHQYNLTASCLSKSIKRHVMIFQFPNLVTYNSWDSCFFFIEKNIKKK